MDKVSADGSSHPQSQDAQHGKGVMAAPGWRSAMILAGAVVFILVAFQPFGTAGDPLSFKGLRLAGYGVPVALAALLVAFARRSMVRRRPAAEGKWWFEGLVAFSTVSLAAPFSYAYFSLAISPHPWTLSGLVYFYKLSLLVGALPAAYLVHTAVARHRSRAALPPQAGHLPPTAPGPAEVELVGENRNDRLRLPVESILWVCSADNYCEIFHDAQGKTTASLLRSSLTSLEEQLADTGVLRCHRGYLVNLDRVTGANGNAAGYRLKVPGAESAIPVSRRYVPSLQPRLSRLARGDR